MKGGTVIISQFYQGTGRFAVLCNVLLVRARKWKRQDSNPGCLFLEPEFLFHCYVAHIKMSSILSLFHLLALPLNKDIGTQLF